MQESTRDRATLFSHPLGQMAPGHNKSSGGAADYEVNWLKGSRNYVRVADVLAVAPLPREATRIQLFFHSVTNCRGSWLPWEQSRNLDANCEIVATLEITESRRAGKWVFVVERSSPITKRIEDDDEERLTSSVEVSEGRSSHVVTAADPIWDQIIASAKALGLVLYPDVRWYVLYLKADLGRFPAVIAGRTMNVQIRRTRLALIELVFSIDGIPLGTIGVCGRTPKEKTPSP